MDFGLRGLLVCVLSLASVIIAVRLLEKTEGILGGAGVGWGGIIFASFEPRRISPESIALTDAL